MGLTGATACELCAFWRLSSFRTPSRNTSPIFDLSQIPALLQRAMMFQVHSGATKRPSTVKFHSIAVQRVIHMIRERLDNDISLKEMAALAYMSRCHFS